MAIREVGPVEMDRTRALERCKVHFDGNASRLVDLVRGAFVFDTSAELYATFERLQESADVVYSRDRFAQPAYSGYQDLLLRVRASNGFISSLRFLAPEFQLAKAQELSIYSRIGLLESILVAGRSFRVVVCDLYNHYDPDSRTVISGFENFDCAAEYARRRTWDSIEMLRSVGHPTDDLREKWLTFGELVSAVDADGARSYIALDELEQLLVQGPAPVERDWNGLAEAISLKRVPLRRQVTGDELDKIVSQHSAWLRSRPVDLEHIGLGHLVQAMKDQGIVCSTARPGMDEYPAARADLRGASVYSEIHHKRCLVGANFQGALANEIDFRDSIVHGCNFYGARMADADLRQALFITTSLSHAKLNGANLSEASLIGADLDHAELSNADLSAANLTNASLINAKLAGAHINKAILRGTDLEGADLSCSDLQEADLEGARLIGTELSGANLSGARIYGSSVWDASIDEATKQNDLVVSPSGMATITADSIEVGQLIYLLLKNEKARSVMDALATKIVLILGRFSEPRKLVLDAIRAALRCQDLVPVMFDFEKPTNRDLTETISTLAHLARLVIADLTDARCVGIELQAIVPVLPSVPVLPLLEAGAELYPMFDHIQKYPWVREVQLYEHVESLVASLPGLVRLAARL
jgi:uncharacterized protein YjbI with pentapeptide repeats